jgi:DNA-binding NarL/FixJ family response regulator
MAKNGLGRKPWVPDLEKVEELASRGLTNDQIAAALGISG